MDQKDLREKMEKLEQEFSELTEKEGLTEVLPTVEEEGSSDTPVEQGEETQVTEPDDVPATTPKKPRKKKRRLWVIVLILFLLLVGFSVFRDFSGSGGDKTQVTIEVADGAGSSAIAAQLKEAGMIRYPLAFKLYARLQGEIVYQKGIHFVADSMSYSDLLEVMGSAPDVSELDKKVIIPEGYELWQIVDALVESGLGDEATFYHEIENGVFDFPFVAEIPRTENRLEGYLYPDTYLFSPEESEHDILNRMLENFSEKVLPVYRGYGSDKTLDEILIFASVIEREAANDAERPLVASVFQNRMEIGMKLESCATVQYILKERKLVLDNNDIAIESPYNTYLNPGLPVGPIASPGISSIKAALYPADTKYLYFLATPDGSENLFSETFEEHNQKLAETQG